jgi:hypothetical protein
MTRRKSQHRFIKRGLEVCTLLVLILPPSYLGNTSYTPQSSGLKESCFVFSGPNARPYDTIIEVDLRKLFLVLREQGGAEIRKYPIAGPKEIPKPLMKRGELFGKVQSVIINPWWYPTPELRQEWLAKGRELSERIPPGHPLNAMGRAKSSSSLRTIPSH